MAVVGVPVVGLLVAMVGAFTGIGVLCWAVGAFGLYPPGALPRPMPTPRVTAMKTRNSVTIVPRTALGRDTTIFYNNDNERRGVDN